MSTAPWSTTGEDIKKRIEFKDAVESNVVIVDLTRKENGSLLIMEFEVDQVWECDGLKRNIDAKSQVCYDNVANSKSYVSAVIQVSVMC